MDNTRRALETHLSSCLNPIEIDYDNVTYNPTNGVPYLSIDMLRGHTDDVSLAFDDKTIENGIFQLSLYYPTANGSADAEDKAIELVSHYKRGTTIPKGNREVRILKMPTFKNFDIIDDRFVIIVSIVYKSHSV
ncbi:MAG: phage tail terminator-like protein [Campylobacterota bacterium]|nr:phage tail terminator-like protein [Campylobacterota bacterium]